MSSSRPSSKGSRDAGKKETRERCAACGKLLHRDTRLRLALRVAEAARVIQRLLEIKYQVSKKCSNA
jgi:hypothetical protein